MDTKSDVRQTIEGARDVISVQRVFGDPYEKNGVTVIPAARVREAPVAAVATAPAEKAPGSAPASASTRGRPARS